MNVDAFIKRFLLEQKFLEICNRSSERIRREWYARDSLASVPTGKALDALWTRSKPYIHCEDGIMRTAEERKAWIANDFKDERSDAHKRLKAKHCSGRCSTVRGHICSCGH